MSKYYTKYYNNGKFVIYRGRVDIGRVVAYGKCEKQYKDIYTHTLSIPPHSIYAVFKEGRTRWKKKLKI